MIAYKLFKRRKDGSIGPLFINARARLEKGVWYQAEDHPTKGFAHRPGWHCTLKPEAPHLSEQTTTQRREWFEVEIEDYEFFERPPSQGGRWALAQRMKIVGPVREKTPCLS